MFRQIELSLCDVIVFEKVPLEMESLHSVGGAITFIALFQQIYTIVLSGWMVSLA